MKRFRISTLVSTTLIVLGTAACQSEDAQPRDAPTNDPVPPAAEAEQAPDAEIAYEPAYPADVSEEGLTDADTSQQENTHSHGGVEHSHDDPDAAHDEDEGQGGP